MRKYATSYLTKSDQSVTGIGSSLGRVKRLAAAKPAVWGATAAAGLGALLGKQWPLSCQRCCYYYLVT